MSDRFKPQIALILLVLTAASPAAAAAGDADLQLRRWESAVDNALGFFDRFAWDEGSGSYASELREDGSLASEVREIVPLSRMIYANAYAAGGSRSRARASADFVLRHMLAIDPVGLWFRSAVGRDGAVAANGRSYLYIFEQAYPLAGLVALYEADPVANADLLPTIRAAAQGFWNRFHDPKDGGLYYYFNVENQNHTNDRGEEHKSYQSTVYPISSFLLALRRVDAENRAIYDAWIKELLDVAVTHIVEWRDGEPTGWLLERASPSFVTDSSYVMSEAGHVTQLAWVLGESVAQGVVEETPTAAFYERTAQRLLARFLDHGGINPSLGCVYDAFNRTDGTPVRDSAGRATTAWWSNLEALIAFSLAERHGWQAEIGAGRMATAREGLERCYFDRFVDRVYGGEFFRIDADSGAVIDPTKGNGGKSAYHIVEAYRYITGSLVREKHVSRH